MNAKQRARHEYLRSRMIPSTGWGHWILLGERKVAPLSGYLDKLHGENVPGFIGDRGVAGVFFAGEIEDYHGTSHWLSHAAQNLTELWMCHSSVEKEFMKLADQWRSETALYSSVEKMAMHPAYQRIIGMGRDALPLILRELYERPDHWFWALTAISGEDPVKTGSTFNEAKDTWIMWGKMKGLLP
jgi:hypothetical protein